MQNIFKLNKKYFSGILTLSLFLFAAVTATATEIKPLNQLQQIAGKQKTNIPQITTNLVEQKGRSYWVEIKASTKQERSALYAGGLDMVEIGTNKVSGFITDEDLAKLEETGIKVLAKTLKDTELQRSFSALAFPSQDAAYHDYDEMLAAILAIAEKHPKKAYVFSIGKTVEGRDIWCLRFNTNATNNNKSKKPGVFIYSTMHAREHLTTEVALGFAQWISDNIDEGEVKEYIAKRDIFIVPMANPDGVEYDIEGGRYKMHRKNTNRKYGAVGVDLNRNFPKSWNTTGASNNPRAETYQGPNPLSEPEAQAVKAFLDKHSNITILNSVHTFGGLVLYPWGDTYDPISDANQLAAFKRIAGKLAGFTGYKAMQASDLYTCGGEMSDWTYDNYKIFSFVTELEPKQSWGGGGFYPGAGVIAGAVERNNKAFWYMVKIADDPINAK